MWTRYDEDEADVKAGVADAILDDVIADTVQWAQRMMTLKAAA